MDKKAIFKNKNQKENGEVLTAPTSNAGGHQSFCKQGRCEKDNYYSVQKTIKHSIIVSSNTVDNG